MGGAIAYYATDSVNRTLFSSTLFLQEPVNFIVKLQKCDLNKNQKFSQMSSQCAISTL